MTPEFETKFICKYEKAVFHTYIIYTHIYIKANFPFAKNLVPISRFVIKINWFQRHTSARQEVKVHKKHKCKKLQYQKFHPLFFLKAVCVSIEILIEFQNLKALI